MSRPRLTVALACVLAAGVAALAPSSAQAASIEIPNLLEPIDIEGNALTCLEAVPQAISVSPEPTTLDVRVLLDGVDQSVAEEAVEAMRTAYTPLDIAVVATYQPASFATSVAGEVNQAAKELFGGVRPPGVDVVYTITDKDLTSEAPTGDNVAGQADCIGGLRFDEHAFAVGEVLEDGPASLLGIPLPTQNSDATGKTMAHEIGHLLGGHHHLFSPEGLLADDPNVASLMGPAVSIISLRFSTVNAAVVRGHMERYGDN